MRVKKDLKGQKFGMLTVVERYVSAKSKRLEWVCVCDCGNDIVARQDHLLSGNTKSCGCLRRSTGTFRLRKISSANKSGYPGINFNETYQKWTATITFRRKTTFLGYFADKSHAVKARKEAEEELSKKTEG